MYLSIVCLYSDAFDIQEGIGAKLSLVILWMSAFVGSMILGFIIDWRMSLVVVGFVPFIVVAAAAGAEVCTDVAKVVMDLQIRPYIFVPIYQCNYSL